MMNWNSVSSLLKGVLESGFPTMKGSVRYASKKAGGSCRNAKQAPGKHYGIRAGDGTNVVIRQLLVKQNRFRYFPGMNVIAYGSKHLRALKSGTVRITCEIADMDHTNSLVNKEYPDTEGVAVFKKYVNVIPHPQHKRFKLVSQI